MVEKRRPVWWTLFGLVLTGLLLWRLAGPPAPVSAHALLVRSIPEANTELSQPPATIEMWFSEPLETGFSSARLLNSRGEEVPTGSTRVDPMDPTHLSLSLGQLEPGIYTVAWQTLSRTDGHEFYGSFPLTLLNPDGSRPAGVAAGQVRERGELPTPGEIVARWLVLLGGMLFLGAPLFYRWVVLAGQAADSSSLVDDTRVLVLKAVWAAGLAIVVGGWLQIILLTFRLGELNGLPNLLLGTRTGVLGLTRQALVLTGLLLALWRLRSARPAREPRFWLEVAVYLFIVLVLLSGAILKTEWLVALSAIAISAVGLAPLIRRPGQVVGKEVPTCAALMGLAAVLLLSFSLGSHAGAAPGWVWAVLGDYLHLLAAAAWLGGLALLPLLTWQVWRAGSPSTSLWPLVQRFSGLAALAVFALSVTGLFNSLVQLPSLASLLETAYGRVLLVKLGLTGLVLGLAFLNNRLVHRRPPPLQQPEAWPRFQRQVTLEAGLSLILMVSVAILVQTPTPASFAATTTVTPPSEPFSYLTQADDLSLHIEVLPNQVGQNLFLVHLYHADNSPIGEVQLVRLLFDYQQAQLGQAQTDLAPQGGNSFGVEGAFVNQAGLWKLSVYVRRRGLDDTLTEVNLDVPPPPSPTVSASPWQNPIPGWPVGLVIGGVVGAVGGGFWLWSWLRRR